MSGTAPLVRLGERSLLVRFPDQDAVLRVAAALADDLDAGRLEDVVPADGSVLIAFDGSDAGERRARRAIARAVAAASEPVAAAPPRRTRAIPVHYGDTDGPDLVDTARLVGMTADAYVASHAGPDYAVRFVGFAPGFAYLGDVPRELAVPRLEVPRTTTPAGSVAVAEGYTGIYPAALPGGWRVIGWTPIVLFDPASDPPTYLRPGDRVRFVPTAPDDLPAAPHRPADW